MAIVVEEQVQRAVETLKLGSARVVVSKIGNPYGLIAPGTNVYFRTWINSSFSVDKLVDFVWFVGDYDPSSGTFTYYPPILYILDVNVPANTTGHFDTSAFALPDTWGSGLRDVLVWACSDFDPNTATCTGQYSEYLEEDVFTIESISVTDVALLTA